MTITLTREEAQRAADALDGYHTTTDERKQLIETLRARLAQPEPEPVAWISPKNLLYRSVMEAIANGEQALHPLYTASPQREWQGLTDEEIRQLEIMEDEEEERKGWCDPKLLIAWTEAKLKEKNGN